MGVGANGVVPLRSLCVHCRRMSPFTSTRRSLLEVSSESQPLVRQPTESFTCFMVDVSIMMPWNRSELFYPLNLVLDLLPSQLQMDFLLCCLKKLAFKREHTRMRAHQHVHVETKKESNFG